jgi:hypothetical protein
LSIVLFWLRNSSAKASESEGYSALLSSLPSQLPSRLGLPLSATQNARAEGSDEIKAPDDLNITVSKYFNNNNDLHHSQFAIQDGNGPVLRIHFGGRIVNSPFSIILPQMTKKPSRAEDDEDEDDPPMQKRTCPNRSNGVLELKKEVVNLRQEFDEFKRGMCTNLPGES